MQLFLDLLPARRRCPSNDGHVIVANIPRCHGTLPQAWDIERRSKLLLLLGDYNIALATCLLIQDLRRGPLPR